MLARCAAAVFVLLLLTTGARGEDELRRVHLEGSTEGIRAVQFAEKAGTVTAIDRDRVVHTWNLRDGKEHTRQGLPASWTGKVTLALGGRVALGATESGALEVIELGAAKPRRAALAPHPDDPLEYVELLTSASGEFVIAHESGESSDDYFSPTPQRRRLLRLESDGSVSVVRDVPYAHKRAFASGNGDWIVRTGDRSSLSVVARDGSVPPRHLRLAAGSSSADLGAIAVSSDGRWIARLSRWKPVHVYDVATGQRVLSLDGVLDADVPQGRPMPWDYGTLAFLPRKPVLAVAEPLQRTVRLWSLETGGVIHDLVVGDDAAVSQIDVSPSGKYLAARATNGITVWELDWREPPLLSSNAYPLPTPPEPAMRFGGSAWRTPAAILSLSISPDGRTLVAGTAEGQVLARDAETGATRWATSLVGGDVMELLHSRDGNRLFCARSHARVAVLDAATGAVIDEIPHDDTLGGMFQNAHTMTLSKDGARLALGGSRGIVVWNLEKDAGEAVFPGWMVDLELGVETPFWPAGLVFDRRGSLLLSFCHDGRSRVHDLDRMTTDDADATQRPTTRVVVSSDGDFMANGGSEGGVFLTATPPGSAPSIRGTGFGRGLETGVAFLPGVPRDALAIRPGGTEVWWSDADGQVVRGRRGKSERLANVHGAPVGAIAFSPDGATAFTGSEDRTICRWDVASGVAGARPEGHLGSVDAIAFAPDGRTLVSAGRDDGLIAWSVPDGRLLRRIDVDGETILQLGFSPSGTTLAVATSIDSETGGRDGTRVRAWRMGDGKEVLRHDVEAIVPAAVTIDDAGQRAILCSRDGGVQVLSGAGAPVDVALGGTRRDVPVAASLTSDGATLLVTARRGVRVVSTKTWSVTQSLKGDPDGNPLNWVSAALAMDGKRVVGVDVGGRQTTWELATGNVLETGVFALRSAESAQICSEATTVALAATYGLIIVRRLADDRHVLSLCAGRTETDRAAYALAPDGSLLATGEADGSIVLWRLP